MNKILSNQPGDAFDALHAPALWGIDACLESPPIWHRSAETIGTGKGAYLLCLALTSTLTPVLRGKKFAVEPGLYVYAGSAKGPGGLAARVGRHLRQEKVQRWHIDRLTVTAAWMRAAAFLNLTECDLVSAMRRSTRFDTPIAGFGSSDCTVCPAHLLRHRPD